MMQVKRAAALGFFDGIHIGHAALMRRLLSVCSGNNLTPAVITFDMLPQNMLNKTKTPLINSPEDRIGLIRRMFGIDDIIFLRFDNEMAAMTCSDFIDRLIIDYNIQHIIAGRNFRFGSGAKGNCYTLKQLGINNGLGCDIIPEVECCGIVSSSTYIRELLRGGDIERANVFLGHPHVFTGIVHSGKKLGSALGAPTLNMSFDPDVLMPAYGVYATKVYLEDTDQYTGMNMSAADIAGAGLTGVTNIGIRPTVDDSGNVTAETHIPDFKDNLYGCKVRIEFHSYLRPELKFGSTEELKVQIKKDCRAAIKFFDNIEHDNKKVIDKK